MSLTIWKYIIDLPTLDEQGKVHVADNGCSLFVLRMRKGARILSLQMVGQPSPFVHIQAHMVLCMWTLVDNEADQCDRAFVVVPTGGGFGRHEPYTKPVPTLADVLDGRLLSKADLAFVNTFQVWRQPDGMPNPLVFHLWAYEEGSQGEQFALADRDEPKESA